ncbi:MAG: ABC transporter permease [Cytophagales bacterium]|nr:ABC transporter permease [Cytophagales bacterium]
MNLSFFIAGRYFRTKKKQNFSNVITRISMIGIAVGTMALIIVLSVYNGMGDLVKGQIDNYDPDLKIEPVKGKTFVFDESMDEKIRQVEGVEVLSSVLEDNAYARYQKAEMVVRLKGVSPNFLEQSSLPRTLLHGQFVLEQEQRPFAVIGDAVEGVLSVNLKNEFYPLRLYYPKKGKVSIDPRRMLKSKPVMASGVFNGGKEHSNYVLVPAAFAEALMDQKGRRTSLEIKLGSGASLDRVQKQLKKVVGKNFTVKNREEQQAIISKVLRIEKLFFVIALSFILFIASFNVFFSLSMLAIDKKKDIAILYAMGARNTLIRRIYLAEGGLIAFSGASIGMVLGLLVCWVQKEFGFVKLVGVGQAGNWLPYPVSVHAADVFLIIGIVVLITVLASYRPASLATKYNNAANL